MVDPFGNLLEYLNKTGTAGKAFRVAILLLGDRISCKIKETCHNATGFC